MRLKRSTNRRQVTNLDGIDNNLREHQRIPSEILKLRAHYHWTLQGHHQIQPNLSREKASQNGVASHAICKHERHIPRTSHGSDVPEFLLRSRQGMLQWLLARPHRKIQTLDAMDPACMDGTKSGKQFMSDLASGRCCVLTLCFLADAKPGVCSLHLCIGVYFCIYIYIYMYVHI